MSRTVRAFGSLALMILFLAGPAAAATPSPGSGVSLWDSAWQWLVELVLPDGPVPDPEAPEPGTNGGDAGGAIDPNGVTVFGVSLEPRAEAGPAVR